LYFEPDDFIDYFYDLVDFLFQKNKKVHISDKAIKYLKSLPLNEKIIAIGSLKLEEEKMQRIAQNYSPQDKIYKILAMKNPFEVDKFLNLKKNEKEKIIKLLDYFSFEVIKLISKAQLNNQRN